MIPQLLLEEINLGEKRAEDFYDKYGKEELDAALAELKKSDEEIFSKYPMKDIQKKIIAKSMTVVDSSTENSESSETESKVKKGFWSDVRRVRFFGAAAAAAFVAMFSVPFLTHMSAFKQPEVIRLKGVSSKQSLKLYKQSGNDAILLNNGDRVNAGDVIQISYVPGKNDYGIIFSIDGNGNVIKHFPDSTWKAAKLNHNMTEVPLDFSYELDNAPDYECFVFVTGDKPFVLDELSMIDSSNVKLDIIKSSQYIPKICTKSIFMLKK